MWNHQEGSKNIPCCEKVFSTRYFSIKWYLSSRWPSTWRWESCVHVGSCYWNVSSRDGRYSERLDWSCSGLWSRTVAAVSLPQIKGDRIPRSWAPLQVGPSVVVVPSLSGVQTLQPHQHARLHCPSLSPWVCSNSCPLSWWCHPTISSSVTSFSSCP